MDNITVLVLANPADPQLVKLEALPESTSIAVGLSPEAFERTAPDATVLLNWALQPELLREVFGMCTTLQWVHMRSAGLDTQLFPELVHSPVTVTNTKGIYSESLGEFALAAILYFAKDFRRMIRDQAASRWEPFDVEWAEGATVGIVGYGDIGRAAARKARACGMKVLALKRNVPGAKDEIADRVYAPHQRVEMLGQCDYVVCAAPLTPETHGMIGEAEFAAMKSTCVIINVGRGPVIDEAAMIRALEENRIKGAALDVFTTEPLPAGHPFYRMENVLLSPHCADHTPDWTDNAMRFFLEEFERFRKGEPLQNIVDKRAGY
jgi:phosphoglycerate dehydrogenase-like enzyme